MSDGFTAIILLYWLIQFVFMSCLYCDFCNWRRKKNDTKILSTARWVTWLLSCCAVRLMIVSRGSCCRCWVGFWDIRGGAANICLSSSGCLAFRNPLLAPASPVLFDPWHSCERSWDWTWPDSQPDSIPAGLVSTTFSVLVALTGSSGLLGGW